MRTARAVLSVLAGIFIIFSIGDLWALAVQLPLFERIGAGAGLLMLVTIAALSYKEDVERNQREKRYIIVEAAFERGGAFDKFSESRLKYAGEKQRFVESAVHNEIHRIVQEGGE